MLFASDNGCAPIANIPELLAHGHNPSAWFRGHKADIYEGGHRVPLLVRWPTQIRPGTVVKETVCLCDLLATMADILGVPLPDNMGEDSVSNLPLWKGSPSPVRDSLIYHSENGSLSIRQGQYKLEMCPGSGGWSYPVPGTADEEGLPPIQLYHLGDDPGETVNLAEQMPELAQRMRALLVQQILRGRSTLGTPQPNDGAPVWEAVRWMEDAE